jgi:hypothetical protein
MKCVMAFLLSLLTCAAATYDSAELIRNRLSEAGQTNLTKIITTNQHAETISCRIQCGNPKDLAAVREALRQLPDKLRLIQGSNYLIVVVRTPQAARQWHGEQAANQASAPPGEIQQQGAPSQTQQDNPETKHELQRQQDLEAINQLRASIRSAQQQNSAPGQIGLAQAKIDGQQHQLAQMITAYKAKYGQDP